jgi:hypothetical protein
MLTPPGEPLRILLCTDAAREGINLQTDSLSDLVHFDLPWNPSRPEQRNGRIDRKLQPAATVICRYFVYAQRPEDVVLEALVRKTETIGSQLGSACQVLGERIHQNPPGLTRPGSSRGAASTGYPCRVSTAPDVVFCFQRHQARNPARCHLMMVSGLRIFTASNTSGAR